MRRLHLPFWLALVMCSLSAAQVQNNNTTVDPKLFQELRWRTIGPHRGGRVTAVSGVRTQPNTFYIGTVGGGVFKTTNYGITWLPVTDGQISTGSIGALAVSDSNPNVVFAGTGSSAIRSNVILGRGIYKSADAGRTWTFSGLPDAGQIGAIRIHAKNPDIAFAAVLGNPFASSAERGVYRTRDGGRTWQKVLFINNETGFVSLSMNDANPDEIYAGAWRGERKPWTIISGGPAKDGGVYKTTDGGERWTQLTTGMPSNLIGKVWVEIAQSRPNVVYAMVEAPGSEGGVFRSDNSGQAWTLVNSRENLRARPFYFNYLHVNPKNENEVWVSEVNLNKSSDGGKSFTNVVTPHADHHAIWFNPDNPNIMILGSDGGGSISQDAARSWSSILNQPTAEFYHVDTDQQFPYRVYGPQQDNSTVVIASRPPFSWTPDDPIQTWFQASGCESGQIRPTPDGKIVYGDCKGEFGRYNVETGQEQHYWIYPQQRYGLNPKDMKYRFVRQAPIEVSPQNPKVVYHGSQYLHRSTDGGIRWQTISPDLTANEPDKQVPSGEPITRDVTGEEVYSALYAIRASRLEPGVIWTGSNDGPVWVTRDDGKTWKNVTPKNLPPGGRVHTIEDSPHRKGSAYVSVYRLYFGDFKPYLYMTNDYGATWTLLTNGTNGIPSDQPMHVVREDPKKEGLLYAGTWYGAFVSFNQGKNWQPLQQNLPATPVTDIKVHQDDLVISTMGRSFWIMDNISPLRQLAAGFGRPTVQASAPEFHYPNSGVMARGFVQTAAPKKAAPAPKTAPPANAVAPFDPAAKVFLFQPAVTYRTRYAASAGAPDSPEYPRVGARIDFVLAGPPAGEVTLEILDAGGKVVRRYSSESSGAGAVPKKVGMNRMVWDLRYPGPWSAQTPQGEGNGPMVPPGTYRARLLLDGMTKTENIEVKIDPRVAADGVTQADLVEQASFALKVRDLLSDARKVVQRLREARDNKRGDQAKVQELWDKFVDKPGPYPANMLLNQISNISAEINRADQRVGASAIERYNDVLKEFAALKAEVDRVIPAQ